MYRFLVGVGAVAWLFVGAVGCESDDEGTSAVEGESNAESPADEAGETGDTATAEIDEAALVAQALTYEEGGFTQVNAERALSQHAGNLVDIWVSNDALAAYLGVDPEGDEALPDIPAGSMIVKSQFDGEGEFAALTVMSKVGEGFDNGAEDWWWARIEPDGTASFAGQVDFCISCHQPQSGSGWLFGVSPDEQL